MGGMLGASNDTRHLNDTPTLDMSMVAINLEYDVLIVCYLMLDLKHSMHVYMECAIDNSIKSMPL